MWLLSKKAIVRESGLLEGFCDIHCHLLPGVDDGVQETDETLQILAEWEAVGMKEVWLTPHIMEDIPNRPDELRRRFERFMVFYTGNIKLHLGAEHMMDGPFLERLEADDVLPIGKDGKRLLVETSYYIPPMNMGGIIDKIRQKGYEPILAHPERYQYMDFKDYTHWKGKGVLLQLNVPSLVGAYGLEVQAKAKKLLDSGMYDFCGTDTHSKEQVSFFLDSLINKKVVKKVKRLSESQEL